MIRAKYLAEGRLFGWLIVTFIAFGIQVSVRASIYAFPLLVLFAVALMSLEDMMWLRNDFFLLPTVFRVIFVLALGQLCFVDLSSNAH